VAITAFTASDAEGVTGYLVTETSAPPAAAAAGWTGTAPTSYTVSADGTYTLYPWAKDAAGNVSAVFGTGRSVVVDTTKPSVDTFTATSPSYSYNIPITAFVASDAVGVTGYMITESDVAPAAGIGGWAASPPTIYHVTSNGTYTLYPWVKDAAGNVSLVFGEGLEVFVDSIVPEVENFIIVSPSTSLDITISEFTADENVAVTGYLITTSVTMPEPDAAGWTRLLYPLPVGQRRRRECLSALLFTAGRTGRFYPSRGPFIRTKDPGRQPDRCRRARLPGYV